MTKINFTKEHYSKLKDLAVEMLFENGTVTTRMGQILTITDLLHTTTINTLNDLRLGMGKAIEKLENTDEWIADTNTQDKLEYTKKMKNLINLIIGYKRYKLEQESLKNERAELTEKLNKLKEEQKTPKERIEELEAKLNELNGNEEF